MRVYVFAEHYPNPYKPYYDAQLAQLLDDGHDLRVFAFGKYDCVRNATVLDYDLEARTRYLPFTLRSLPGASPGLARELRLRGPGAAARLLRACWDRGQPGKRNLLDAARALNLPAEPPDLCLVHNLLTALYLTFLPRLYPGARVALYYHGGELPYGRPISRQEASRAFAAADRVLTNTAWTRDELVRRGCPPEKVAIVPVGFRLGDYQPPAVKRYRPEGVLRLLTVGRTSMEKGLEYAIDAAARLRARGVDRFRLRMIGAGPRLAELRRQVQAEGLAPLVELVGELPHHALVREYRDADALLLPSVLAPHWAENQACVMQEAMLMKLAVVATRTGGVQESLAPALRRFSVEARDSQALADRVEELLALDEAEWRRLGVAGRAFVEKGYDIRLVNRRLLDLALAAGEEGDEPAGGLVVRRQPAGRRWPAARRAPAAPGRAGS